MGPAAVPARSARRSTAAGLATLAGSGISTQIGAATGSHAFPVIGPVGVVTVRQFVSAAALLALARPRLRTFTWSQWWPALLLAIAFGGMNLTLYTAIDRVGLGLGVTLEFLGPLAIALSRARSRPSVVCALTAVVGVVLVTDPRPSTDWFGIAAGVLSAVGWASYILLNRVVGRRIPGLGGSATAATCSALLFVPVALWWFPHHRPTAAALAEAVAAGLLSSVIPYAADLITLRRLTPQLFAILMSAQPVYAALVGLVALHQGLQAAQWAGIAATVTANVGAVVSAGRGPAGITPGTAGATGAIPDATGTAGTAGEATGAAPEATGAAAASRSGPGWRRFGTAVRRN